MAGQHAGIVIDLHRQFACRCQDQRARLVGAPRQLCRLLVEKMEDRQQECGGLSRSRLRLAGQVLAVEGNWQGLRRDWCAILEAGVTHAVEDCLGKWETIESGLCKMFFAHGRQAYPKSRVCSAKGLN